MTLRSSPLAVDGARIDSASLRIAAFMAGGRYEGVSSSGALKVSALAVPGNGVQIAAGAAMVLNRYQATPDQAYVVSNVGSDSLGSADMPPAVASARSHLICVTVGDPEFSQAGHPWMPGTVPAGEEETFQYVRFFVVQNVPSSTKSFADLNLNYPAYALARIDVPASTTTITNAMIVDLRDIPQPRATEQIQHIVGPSAAQDLNGQGGNPGDFQVFPSTVKFNLDIPKWADRAYVTGFVEGLKLTKAGKGRMRVTIVGVGSTTETNIDEPGPSGGADRRSYNLGGEIAIPSSAKGTTAEIRIEGTPQATADKGFLQAVGTSSGQIRVRLAEKAS